MSERNRVSNKDVLALDPGEGDGASGISNSTPGAPAARRSVLIEAVRQLKAYVAEMKEEPIRTVHHLACTGGTLISRCLAAQANTRVLSEIAPLSTLGAHGPKDARFAPSDLLFHLKTGRSTVSDDELVDIFLASLKETFRKCLLRGERLVIRDHAHSHFCVGSKVSVAPTLDKIVAQNFVVRSVITVRHPLDSYISLVRNGWLHFQPDNIDEYSERYLSFLSKFEGVPMFRYEEFVARPEEVLSEICWTLEIPFNSISIDVFGAIVLSGDSGRTGTVIERRPTRTPPPELFSALRSSTPYQTLCDKLGYHPDNLEA